MALIPRSLYRPLVFLETATTRTLPSWALGQAQSALTPTTHSSFSTSSSSFTPPTPGVGEDLEDLEAPGVPVVQA